MQHNKTYCLGSALNPQQQAHLKNSDIIKNASSKVAEAINRTCEQCDRSEA